jgi:hypothetical protein
MIGVGPWRGPFRIGLSGASSLGGFAFEQPVVLVEILSSISSRNSRGFTIKELAPHCARRERSRRVLGAYLYGPNRVEYVLWVEGGKLIVA